MAPVSTTTALLPAGRPAALATRPVQAAVTVLPDTSRQRGFQRAEFVRAVVEQARETGTSEASACALVAAAEGARFPLLRGKLSYANFQNWKRALRTANGALDYSRVEELADRYATGCRGRHGSAEWWELFYRLYRTPEQLTLEHARELARGQWLHYGRPEAEVPTVRQVSYWLSRYDDRTATLLARGGPADFANQVMGYISRDWSNVRPGDIYVGDHRKLDLMVKAWDTDGRERSERLWLTSWMDAASRRIVSWMMYPAGESPNAIAIATTLGIAIQDCGLPKALYVDNGKDYCAQGLASDRQLLGRPWSSVRDLAIQVIQALPYNARAKTVERFHLEMARDFDPMLPAYIGNSPARRPEGVFQDLREHPEKRLSVHEVGQVFGWWLDQYHAAVVESPAGGAARNRSPAEIWSERRAGPVLSPELLRFSLSIPVAARQVGRGPDGPSVRWANWHYSSPELREYARQHWGDQVVVRLDVLSPTVDRQGLAVPAQVYVCAPDGSAVGVCTAADTVPAWARTDEDRDRLADAMADIRRYLPETRASLRASTGLQRPVSPLEALALPPGHVGRVSGRLLPAPAPADSARIHAPQQPAPQRQRAESAPTAPRASTEDALLLEAILAGRAEDTRPAGTTEPAGETAEDWRLLENMARGGDL